MRGGWKYLLYVLCLLVCLVILNQLVEAAAWETLSPDHWTYKEIRWLQSLGYLQDLNPSHKPYSRGEVAASLNKSELPSGKIARERFNLLVREFKVEVDPPQKWGFTVGGRFFAGVQSQYDGKSRESGYGATSVTVGNNRMGIHTTLRADRDLAENNGYKGKIWSDIAGLTEQAYLVAFGLEHRWELKLGRDHCYWGPGDDHLILNHSARGIDQIKFRVRWSWGEFTALIGQIDDFTAETGARTNRFLSGHRFDFVPWEWLRLGVSETLLFTGGFRFGSMNPFVPYYGELVNENSEGNGLIGIDFNAFPIPGLEVYGELVLDDIQLEKKDSLDLEPTEWGWLIGGRLISASGLVGVGISYEGVKNRTYNALEPKYQYLNYGLPLGSELGNDADKIGLEASIWPYAWLRFDTFWKYHRQGVGSVTAPFDTTYMAFTIDEGYSEPFPSGIVQKTNTIGFGLSVLAHQYVLIEGWMGHDWTQNYGHETGLNKEGFRGRVTVNVWIDRVFGTLNG